MSINLENAEVDFSFTQQQQQQHDNTHEVAADVVLENPMDIFAKLLPLMQQQQLATINQYTYLPCQLSMLRNKNLLFSMVGKVCCHGVSFVQHGRKVFFLCVL